jgi:hypothetical protein
MGYSEVTKNMIETDPSALNRALTSPFAFIRDAINLEIAANPAYVGAPITTAVFDASGLHLIEPGACRIHSRKKE